jgi:hypothetical protein
MVGESALIVFSILLAFSIDAWWSGRGTATLERQWLVELESEFASNLVRLEARNEQIETSLERFELFVRSSPSVLARFPQDSVSRWLYDFTAPRTFDASRGAASTLSDPAGITAVRDPTLRRLVVDWLRRLDDLNEEAASMWSAGTDLARILSLPAVQGELPDGERHLINNVAASLGPAGLANSRTDDRFMSALSIKMYYQNMYLAELRSAQAVGDTILSLLRARN